MLKFEGSGLVHGASTSTFTSYVESKGMINVFGENVLSTDMEEFPKAGKVKELKLPELDEIG